MGNILNTLNTGNPINPLVFKLFASTNGVVIRKALWLSALIYFKLLVFDYRSTRQETTQKLEKL